MVVVEEEEAMLAHMYSPPDIDEIKHQYGGGGGTYQGDNHFQKSV